MKKMKKRGTVILAIVMMASLLGGCAVSGGKKENSVFTGNPDALRVFVRSNSTYADRLKEQFPDIEFDFYYYGGLNTSMIMNQLLERDDMGDICITSLQATDAVAKEHLMNLSGYEVCGRYEPSILNQFDVEGNVYQLPGYVTMRNIIYNKDMFERYGWEEPKNFAELTALCRRIRQEAEGITPIVMAGAAGGYYFTTMTSYAQSEFLYTPDGQQWTEAYHKGEAKAEEGFGEGIRMMQELIDAKAFDYEKNEKFWDGDLFKKRMQSGEAAMMFVWGGQTYVAEMIAENDRMHFDAMPFRNREGQAFIGTNIPYYIALAKGLEEKGNEKKLKDAMRVLEWLSTEEGISALSSDTPAAIFPLKKAENAGVLKIFHDFWNENLDSIKAPMLYAGYEDIIVPVADEIIASVKGDGTLDGLSDRIDEIHQDYLKGGAEAIEVGSFSENFTHKETVQMFAHILRSKEDCEIALVSDGCYKNGVLNSGGVFAGFMKGPVLEDQLTCSLPGEGVNEPVVQMQLTGRQIEMLLENGKFRKAGESAAMEAEEVGKTASFDYYWSGMTVKWNKGKVEKITPEDDRVMEADKTYKVNFAKGDYTEEMEAIGGLKSRSYTTKEIFKEYMKEHSPLIPIPSQR